MRDFSCYEKNIYEKLDDCQMKSVMEKYGIRFRDELPRKIPLLRTPFLLELYCYTRKKLSSKKYDFIHFPSYRGEIIRNFVTVSVAEYDSLYRKDKKNHSLYTGRILPFIAYNMEKDHIYAIRIEDFNGIINKYNLSEEKKEEFLENYFFLRKDRGNISFTHFEFRNYFSAIYIKEKIAEEINGSSHDFPELSCRLFTLPLRHMIGEILSERYGEKTILDSVLDRLRGRDFDKGDYTLLCSVIA